MTNQLNGMTLELLDAGFHSRMTIYAATFPVRERYKGWNILFFFFLYLSLLLLWPQIVTMQFRVLVALPTDESLEQGRNSNQILSLSRYRFGQMVKQASLMTNHWIKQICIKRIRKIFWLHWKPHIHEGKLAARVECRITFRVALKISHDSINICSKVNFVFKKIKG